MNSFQTNFVKNQDVILSNFDIYVNRCTYPYSSECLKFSHNLHCKSFKCCQFLLTLTSSMPAVTVVDNSVVVLSVIWFFGFRDITG